MDTRLKIRQINSNIEALKKSVADGKSAVASAITSKGVSTAADATYIVMAANIRAISNDTVMIYNDVKATTDNTRSKSFSFSGSFTADKAYKSLICVASLSAGSTSDPSMSQSISITNGRTAAQLLSYGARRYSSNGDNGPFPRAGHNVLVYKFSNIKAGDIISFYTSCSASASTCGIVHYLAFGV